jgi:hypothetical protein
MHGSTEAERGHRAMLSSRAGEELQRIVPEIAKVAGNEPASWPARPSCLTQAAVSGNRVDSGFR